MKRYPLQSLLRVRALRVDKALRVLNERRAERDAAAARLLDQQQRLETLRETRRVQHERLAGGLTDPTDLCRHVTYIDALDDAIDGQKRHVLRYEGIVAEAEEALAAANAEWLRARHREAALLERGRVWRSEQLRIELAAEDENAHEMARRNTDRR